MPETIPFITEGPQPLLREIPPGQPYPVHALGPLQAAVVAVQGMTQAPIAIPAQSALAVASLAVQGFADVETLGGVRPLSLYALTIARSGERKSTCDALLIQGLRDHEREEAAQHREDMKAWQTRHALWKVQHDAAINSVKRTGKTGKTQTEAEADLHALGDEPAAPPSPDRTVTEPTYEGLPRGFPRVGPESVFGIELNPYAAELARVSVWIGEIQWMRRNGFEAARNPILRPLSNIENRDSVLAPDGTRADWPDADAVVGNPPFIGNKKMIAELGEDYTTTLRRAWNNVPGGVDFVCYWFAKAWEMIEAGRLTRAGLVATNSIRGGANREVLKPITERGRIFEAWSDEPWTVDGAAVRVSMVCFDGQRGGPARLDGEDVAAVFADLTAARGGVDLSVASRLIANRGPCHQGTIKNGTFDVPGDVARAWLALPLNPNGLGNQAVLKPWANGMDLTRRPSGRWIVDFGVDMTMAEAALFEQPFAHVYQNVKPHRDKNRNPAVRDTWWLFEGRRVELRKQLASLERYIATPRVAKYRLFVWLPKIVVPDTRLVVIARDDDAAFGILHSRFHELWTLALGGWHGVGNDPQYTPSLGFETFPFPDGLTPDIPAPDYAADPRAQAIAAAAARLNELRENWLNPPDLVRRVPEVVPGYPDRILPVDDKAERELKKRTLTNLYNARPAWLDHAHKALDEAVAEAYGWGDDWRAGALNDDEILSRLFRLNQDRAARQGQGL